MPAFRTILVAADFSEQSKGAFRVACALAEETKTHVFVLHTVELPLGSGGLGMLIPVSPDENLYFESLQGRLREEYAPDRPLDVVFRVRDGAAVEAVLREADEIGADLIVLGTHGRTGVRRLLVGSVAEAILRRAPCSVLALHASETTGRPLEGGMILHPTDFSENSEPALRVARALARDCGEKLMILNVIPDDLYPGEGMIPPLDVRPMREGLEEIRRRADGEDLKYPVETDLRRGVTAAEILDAAKTNHCNLIVLGTHGRTGVARLLMGSVTEAVLRRAACPVLAVKSHETAKAALAPDPVAANAST